MRLLMTSARALLVAGLVVGLPPVVPVAASNVGAGRGTVAHAASLSITAESAATPASADLTPVADGDHGRYTVRPGDTLTGIAARLRLPGGWPALYAANRGPIGPDPDLIRPGTILTVPSSAPPALYTVRPGDTLAGIAARLRLPGGWSALYAANRGSIGPDPDLIRPGTTIALPRVSEDVHRVAVRPAPRPSRAEPPLRPGGDRPVAAIPHLPRPGPEHSQPPVPDWLAGVLLAVGLVAVVAFTAPPLAAGVRRVRRRLDRERARWTFGTGEPRR